MYNATFCGSAPPAETLWLGFWVFFYLCFLRPSQTVALRLQVICIANDRLFASGRALFSGFQPRKLPPDRKQSHLLLRFPASQPLVIYKGFDL